MIAGRAAARSTQWLECTGRVQHPRSGQVWLPWLVAVIPEQTRLIYFAVITLYFILG